LPSSFAVSLPTSNGLSWVCCVWKLEFLQCTCLAN
jgi:hypothetical protein